MQYSIAGAESFPNPVKVLQKPMGHTEPVLGTVPDSWVLPHLILVQSCLKIDKLFDEAKVRK